MPTTWRTEPMAITITMVTIGRQRRNVGSERKEKEKLERMRQKKKEEFARQVFDGI